MSRDLYYKRLTILDSCLCHVGCHPEQRRHVTRTKGNVTSCLSPKSFVVVYLVHVCLYISNKDILSLICLTYQINYIFYCQADVNVLYEKPLNCFLLSFRVILIYIIHVFRDSKYKQFTCLNQV